MLTRGPKWSEKDRYCTSCLPLFSFEWLQHASNQSPELWLKSFESLKQKIKLFFKNRTKIYKMQTTTPIVG